MDSFIYSLNATIPIFLVMIAGGIIKKAGIVNDNFVDVANRYVYKVALPILLYMDIATADIRNEFDVKFVLFCAGVTTICFVMIWILTEIFMKDNYMKGSFVQGSFRSSAAVLGMAFIQNMYEDAGMAPLMIVSAVPLYNVFSVIVLTFKAEDNQGKGTIKKACINILKNPIIIGIVLGLITSLSGVKLPVIASKTLTSFSQTATPLALICIGAGFEGRKAIKKIVPTVIGSAIKLVIQPAIFIPAALYFGFRNQELVAILIMLASPSTVSCYIMAKNMKNDAVLSSSIIVLTTLLSSITLTAWIFFLKSGGYI